MPSPAASPARGEWLTMGETLDIVTPQLPGRCARVTALTASYGVVVTSEGRHLPAAAFEHAVKQIPASGAVSIRQVDHPALFAFTYLSYRYNRL